MLLIILSRQVSLYRRRHLSLVQSNGPVTVRITVALPIGSEFGPGVILCACTLPEPKWSKKAWGV